TPVPFSTPRAWASLARALDLVERAGLLNKTIRRALANGRVSAEDATAFCQMVEEEEERQRRRRMQAADDERQRLISEENERQYQQWVQDRVMKADWWQWLRESRRLHEFYGRDPAKKIPVIKEVRTMFQTSLREAKDAYEAAAALSESEAQDCLAAGAI